MDDAGTRLLEALGTLEELSVTMSPEVALHALGNVDLQVFWREWPELNTWAALLWHSLDVDLAGPATMQIDPELDEVGDSD